ncbi:MAG: DUF2905 family protein [Acidiferrobacter sp.]
MGRLLLVSGIVLIVAGLAWEMLDRLPGRRLSGDFVFRVGDVRIHVLWAASLLLSLVLTLLLWITRR